MRFAGEELLNGQPAEATVSDVAYNPDGYFDKMSRDEIMYKRQQLELQQRNSPSFNAQDIKLPQDKEPASYFGVPPTQIELLKDRFLLHSPDSPIA